MEKYLTKWNNKIEKIEVIRETAQFYVVACKRWEHKSNSYITTNKERREKKDSNYHNTARDALNYLIERADSNVASAISVLHKCTIEHERLVALGQLSEVEVE